MSVLAITPSVRARTHGRARLSSAAGARARSRGPGPGGAWHSLARRPVLRRGGGGRRATAVSHTLRKHSTRPHDTTRSNLTGFRSRRATRSEGAAQKSVLHRDQRLLAATAGIDPAATGRRRSARSTGAGDERGDSRPLDCADPAATACDHVLTAGMPLERAECRPASAASHFLSPD